MAIGAITIKEDIMADKKITTAEEAAKLMVENNPDFAIEHITKILQADPQNLQSWLDWYNKEGEFPE